MHVAACGRKLRDETYTMHTIKKLVRISPATSGHVGCGRNVNKIYTLMSVGIYLVKKFQNSLKCFDNKAEVALFI